METTKAYKKYLRLYGPHFTKKLCEFAVSLMDKGGIPIKVLTKQDVEDKLKQHNITLQHNQFEDHVYVANMCKFDFLGKSVPDEAHLYMYVKDVIDDYDGYDGQVFYRWLSDVKHMGIPVDWSEFV